ncbi:hypothetical protein DCS_02182 [Drechmeria coniospora]|uniref:Alpha/beta hydrolase fold-3 domain-containing protein n=1 Tax=Drechmeria coniospora TaxID=98403 RepID=A0A151GVI5_DRECN|nr:hypothetical protein DCS_02182 [Drechmeria coniospora]KYK61042.1 hypothetical protein DCS_02182 [Drechmeria coniospora]
MQRWPRRLRALWPRRGRCFSCRSSPERFSVRCGSAGHVTVDLFNRPEGSPESALLLHIPPFPCSDGAAASLPEFLQHLPVASINYRWGPTSLVAGHEEGMIPRPFLWPTPIHDVAIAYAWLVEKLAPPGNSRRNIYVYGSHLGASLATSLSLTEAHTHARFGIRGLVTYNGIYNWTMFLPDHRVNKRQKKGQAIIPPPQPAEGSHLHNLQQEMPRLFEDPSQLFDSFASPSLFFHSPGLHVPRSFSMSTEDTARIDALAAGEEIADSSLMMKAPRKSHMIFPPRSSTLKIPETLLLHDSDPLALVPLKTKSGRAAKRARAKGNTFGAQAEELAELMRRSIEVVELKQRRKWDEDMHFKEDEARRRVQVVDVGSETASTNLGVDGRDVATAWLQHRLS